VRLDPARADEDRRTLADTLRDLRRASGLSGERLARRCGMSQSKVSRIESGRALPSVVDVEQMLDGLGVDPGTREELLTLTRIANAEYQDIRAVVRKGLHLRQKELATLEHNATYVRFFLPALITGLLQTPEYMRAAMRSPVDPVSADRSRAIALKLERQAVLHDQTKRFDFLLTESAVRWQLCEPSVMASQLDRLVSASRLPSVRIGILPQGTRIPDGPMSGFVVYDARLVTIELFTGQVVLRDPKDTDYYRALFDFFSAHALWSDDARTQLSLLADAFRAAKQCGHVHSSGIATW
jgi:transcriptional regulator with XRE-family HTH domain